MIIKPYDLYKLDETNLSELREEINEGIDIYNDWIIKIMNENSIEGMENILQEMETTEYLELYESKFWEKLKQWGTSKLRLLQRKYQSLINNDTFKKVKEFLDSGGEFPKTKKEQETLASEDPELANALDIINKKENN